jgi:membrane associated rhomboid family serine protease
LNTFLLLIIGLNVLISYRSFDNQLMEKLLFSPYLIKYNNQWYRLFTHSWIHADWQHLLFNMVSLFYIGDVLIKECWIPAYGEVEGMVLFLILYIIGGVAATVLPYLKNKENYSYRALGASGAVSAVIFAAILWQPNMPLGLLFIPFSIPAYIFGPLYLLIEYFAMRNIKTGVAHDAHLGGALFGILFVLLLNIEKGKEFLDLFF